jgi:hypothetical protein
MGGEVRDPDRLGVLENEDQQKRKHQSGDDHTDPNS